MDIKKLFVIFAFLMLLMISPSFANDNTTEIPVNANYGDVYFNSSSLNDGDGSFENPYNRITMDRINNYATLYLADGEYNVSGFKTISSLSIVGESTENTIIRHDGLLFTVLSELSLNNLTLSGVTIKNQGLINGTNVIFSDSHGTSDDRYGNVFGGVFDNNGDRYITPTLYLDSCVFKNNHADYGGAIYLINSNAFIYNCIFERNTAYNYGGAIACDGSVRLDIKNTRFRLDSSTNDVGGALYLKNSLASITNSNFTNCNSSFGGAICDLNSDLSVYDSIFSSNTAEYDGGAIFKMYGNISVENSKFNFNYAENGGAIFADNSSLFNIQSSRFSSNNANNYGGAIYSLLNNNSIIKSNIYTRNKANEYPNTFETDFVNPFVGNNNYSMFKYDAPEIDLPARYSSVDEGFVTPVKDQQASGNCWAFTAIATLESCLLKASNVTYDLSEENLKNLIALYSDYGWDMDTNNGGYDNMAIGYLASWLGPVLEENDPFDDYSTVSPLLDSIMHVQNILFLGRDNFTDNDRIKEAIIKYGAVGTGIYYSGSYLFGDAYYYSSTESENHAVTIVGWDDDYPYYKFRNPAPANGAWIVKNSWKDNWADNGYFYVSYYDTRFARVGNDLSSYTFILNDTLRYDKNYQYDIIGLTKFISTANNEVWYENIFNSTDDEILASFSTYFSTKSDWTVYVYVNDVLMLKQNGTSSAGYYTFNFNNPIYLNNGDLFKIVVKRDSKFASVPVSEKTYSNKVFYKKGVSFFSYDGEEWYDLYDYESSQVACLKAFTIIPSISLTIDSNDEYFVDELFNITSLIQDNSLNGTVVYNISGDLFIVNMTEGIANLPILFNESGNYEISAYFVGDGIFSNKADLTLKIRDKVLNTTIKLDNITSEIDKNIILNATVYDENNEKVIVGNLTLTVGEDTYICQVNNGSAIKEISFDIPGNYTIVASFNGTNYNPSSKIINVEINKAKLESNITLNHASINTGDEITIISNVLSDNLTVNEGICVFSINNEIEYMINISNSQAIFDISFNQSGIYVIDVRFNHEKYVIDECSVVVNVSDRVSRINISDLKVDVGDKCNVSAIVFDEYDKTINTGFLKFNISNETYYIDLSTYNPILEIIFNESGIYYVSVEFDAFGYQKSFNSSTIEVSKKNLDVNFAVADVYYGDDLVINVESSDVVDVEVMIAGVKYVLRSNGEFIVDSLLDAGDYEAVLLFNGSELYNPLNVNANFTVKKLPLSVDVELENKTLIIQFSQPINDTLSLKVNDENYEVNLINGVSKLDFNNFGIGNYSVVINYTNPNYDDILSEIGNIEISKNDLKVNFAVADVYYGDDLVINVESSDVVDVEVMIAGVKYVLRSNGEFIVDSLLDAGDYEAVLLFNGSELYNPLNVNANFTVKKLPIFADVEFENNTLSIQFSYPINDTVSVKINNQIYNINLENGKSQIDLNGFDVGCYSVVINYNNPNYDYVLENYSFTIPKINTKIIVNDLVKYYRNDSRYEVFLIDENGNYLSNRTVIISLSNVNYTRTTNENGKTSIGVNFNKGNYSATVYFEGDEQFNSCRNSSSIIVKSTIESDDLIKCYRNASQFYVKILDDKGNIVKNAVVSFNINGVFYNRTTNDEGMAKLNINLSPGDYIITTENLITGEKASNNIIVLSLIVENNDLVKFYRNASQYIVKVLGDDGNPVGEGKEVIFNINGVFYHRYTNVTGHVKLNINLNPGNYIITAEYNGCRVSNNITVKPILTANDLIKTYGTSDQFVATLVDGQGNPYTNQLIEFNINGVFYKRTTDNNGQAKLNIRLMPGEYIITSIFGAYGTSNTILIR